MVTHLWKWETILCFLCLSWNVCRFHRIIINMISYHSLFSNDSKGPWKSRPFVFFFCNIQKSQIFHTLSYAVSYKTKKPAVRKTSSLISCGELIFTHNRPFLLVEWLLACLFWTFRYNNALFQPLKGISPSAWVCKFITSLSVRSGATLLVFAGYFYNYVVRLPLSKQGSVRHVHLGFISVLSLLRKSLDSQLTSSQPFPFNHHHKQFNNR